MPSEVHVMSPEDQRKLRRTHNGREKHMRPAAMADGHVRPLPREDIGESTPRLQQCPGPTDAHPAEPVDRDTEPPQSAAQPPLEAHSEGRLQARAIRRKTSNCEQRTFDAAEEVARGEVQHTHVSPPSLPGCSPRHL